MVGQQMSPKKGEDKGLVVAMGPFVIKLGWGKILQINIHKSTRVHSLAQLTTPSAYQFVNFEAPNAF